MHPAQSERENLFKDFQKLIKVKFKNLELLHQVFVHRSYLNENPGFPLNHNERLEFLGDAVLELVVTEYLFITYPNPEGDLTNWRSALVKGQMLASVAQELDMGHLLYLSKGEEKSGGKSRALILANTFEALIGAIYLDLGYTVAQKFVTRNLIGRLPEILEKGLHVDAKSHLQELSQDKLGITPNYKVLSERGPDHAKEFSVGVYVADKLIGEGTGNSKQTAEQAAATHALEHWQHH
jgi:ribonuclease-3